MTTVVSPDDLSTLAYLWRLYDDQPRELTFRARSREEWRQWREALTIRLADCLGGFPKDRCDLAPELAEVVEQEHYRTDKVYFRSEPGVAVPCYVLTPRYVSPPYRPVIALHGHGSDGARLLLGQAHGDDEDAEIRAYNCDYARQLAERGFMVFAPVQRALGECMEADSAFRTGEGLHAKSCEMVARAGLLMGKPLAGLRVWDVMRTADYIRARPEPMVTGIGCLGFSGGGVVALYTAALDARLTAVVLAGAFCEYGASILRIVHCLDNYVPGILRYAEAGDIGGLIAPRPLLVEHALDDPIFPIAGVRSASKATARAYDLLGAPDRLDTDFFPGGHRFGGGKAFDWLARWVT
jgi:dienelactone hydrolase